jgi:MFS family permease
MSQPPILQPPASQQPSSDSVSQRGAGAVITPRVATSAMFFVNGLILATWVLHIPNVRDALRLSDAQVGTAILGMAVGSMCSMPFSGRWIVRWGSAAVTRVFALLFCLSLPLPFLASSLPALFLALMAVGLTNGAMDVAMNAQGVAVEHKLGRPVLSSFHAWFSLGNLGGALLGSLLLGLKVGLWPHVLGTVIVTLLAAGLSGLSLLPRRYDDVADTGNADTGNVVTAPPWWQRLRLSPMVLSIGLVCFLGMLGEGATGDWSSLYFSDILAAGGGLVGLGYMAFTLAMTLGRIFGDRLRSRFGDRLLVVVGGLISGAGVLLASLSPALAPGPVSGPLLAALGYVLTGLGVANIVPVLYGAAGRAMNAHGIAQVATLGYLGFLAGPPLIGYVSHASDLRFGLLVIALSLLLVGVLGQGVFKRLQPGRAVAAD